MALPFGGGFLNQRDVRETPYTTIEGGAAVPIGTVLAWLKSLSGTPSIPAGYVECNGQTISDSTSLYDGVTLPDLNGNNNFLRGGSTSGSTGGYDTRTATGTTDSHTLTISEMPAHTHDVDIYKIGTPGSTQYPLETSQTANGPITFTSDSTGGGGGHTHGFTSSSFDNKPPYYAVVWIIRIK